MINEFSLCVLQGIPKQIISNLRQIQSHLRERKYFHKVWNFSLSNGSFEDVETHSKHLVSPDQPLYSYWRITGGISGNIVNEE